MILAELLKGIKAEVYGSDEVEITSLSCSSTDVKKGTLFFCLVGGQADGHDFAPKAVYDGAVALVVEKKLETTAVTQVVVEDSRAVMALVAKRFYGNAADKLKLIAVVGTNGKTSTTYLINSIFRQAGRSSAVIGTNGLIVDDEKTPLNLTTPDPIELHSIFQRLYEKGVKYVVMELSAHALALRKNEGIKFDVTVFTNFSQDHLDFFENMAEYAAAKMKVFQEKYTKVAVVNADDELGRSIAKLSKVPIDYKEDKDGMDFIINLYDEIEHVHFNLHGKFNLYNILAAATTARVFGIKLPTITQGIKNIKRIDGRNETFYIGDVKTVIDFAHTPDSIKNILMHLKNSGSGKLIVVFGCGGDRDRFKRPLMAQAVSRFADYAIVTNDNPRTENPNSIVQDILPGLNCLYEVELNRRYAIEKAILIAKPGDTVAILGKGAETYQEIAGKKIPYSDFDVINKLIGR
jgi:UDP-N-acetylmuramoyl-L-alanyl-D-glutamate--2,6-diaminopimelate ligase